MADEQTPTSPAPMPESFSTLEDAMNHIQQEQTPQAEQTVPDDEQDDPAAPERSQSDDLAASEQPDEDDALEGEEPEQDSVDEEDGEPDGDDQDPDDEDERLLTVNGEELPESEVVNGYMRQADYTRSKQEIAKQRQDIESQAGQVSQTLQQLGAELAQVEQMFIGEPVPAPDINLLHTDRDAYEYQRVAHEEYIAGYQNVQGFRQNVQQRIEAEQAKAYQEAIQAEFPKLQAAFPEIKDDATLNSVIGRVQGHLVKEYGYAPDELQRVIDHRVYIMADKLRKYDEASASKAKVRPRRGRKKIVSGNSNTPPQNTNERDQARSRFNQTVSQPVSTMDAVEAAAAALAANGR